LYSRQRAEQAKSTSSLMGNAECPPLLLIIARFRLQLQHQNEQTNASQRRRLRAASANEAWAETRERHPPETNTLFRVLFPLLSLDRE